MTRLTLTEVVGCAVSCRERKKVEMLFAHLKRILGLDRLRLRGPNGAKDEFLLAATAQNLRKLAKPIPLPAPILGPHEAERPSFASLTAAADTHRGRLKTGFYNEIGAFQPAASRRYR
jgi:Transposase DDE domain